MEFVQRMAANYAKKVLDQSEANENRTSIYVLRHEWCCALLSAIGIFLNGNNDAHGIRHSTLVVHVHTAADTFQIPD